MPIYEYRCTSCGDEFENIQKVNSHPLRKCKHCSGKLEKLISRSSFQLKGGGWFINDYAGTGRAKKKASATTEKSTDSSSTKQKSSGSDSTSE